MSFEQEAWQRTIFEALRPIDPDARFNVSLAEMDFRRLDDTTPDQFPTADLAAHINRFTVIVGSTVGGDVRPGRLVPRSDDGLTR